MMASTSWLLAKFHERLQCTQLATTTRRGYEANRKAAHAFVTRVGPPGSLQAAALTVPVMQRIVDSIAADGTPSKANHLLRYLRGVYSSAIRRRHARLAVNPRKGVQ